LSAQRQILSLAPGALEPLPVRLGLTREHRSVRTKPFHFHLVDLDENFAGSRINFLAGQASVAVQDRHSHLYLLGNAFPQSDGQAVHRVNVLSVNPTSLMQNRNCALEQSCKRHFLNKNKFIVANHYLSSHWRLMSLAIW
jgi:hypothetical protein